MDGLPETVDVIVLGTGLPESIVAAACSRVGKSVLHFDKKSHYGSHFASYNFKDFNEFLTSTEQTASHNDAQVHAPEGLTFVPSHSQEVISNVQIDFNDTPDWSMDHLHKESRRFNLDLSPRLLFARGKMVELLISSNIAKYAEFKLITRILTLKDGVLEQVPCSRADVFTTRNVNVVEKRALMKLMTSIIDFESQPTYTDWLEKPLTDFLHWKDLHLTDNLRHFFLNSIAMAESDTPTGVALSNARKFIQSLGRYGNSPFLCPIYGCGELAQCFCRLCAVFGGVYHLERKTDGFLVDATNQVKAVVSQGETFHASHVVTNTDFSPKANRKQPLEYISRAIVIVKESMLPVDKEQMTLLRVPANEQRSHVTVIELGPGMMVCPKGLIVAHLTCRKGSDSAKEDLQEVVDKLYSKEHQIWSSYFNMVDTANDSHSTTGDVSGLYTVSTPGLHLDYDFHIDQAKHIFHKMYLDEEFLPRAPDPEEIILDFDDQQQPVTETSSQGTQLKDELEKENNSEPQKVQRQTTNAQTPDEQN